MSGFFSEEIIEEIRARIDLAEYIGEYVDLKKQGNRFIGRCPFHADKTPSFHVTPENGLFYCFGCGTGGDLFSFLMKLENLDFPQAVEKLARRAGISLAKEEQLSPVKRQSLQLHDRLREVNRQAALYFYRCLRGEAGREARSYLEARQITAAAGQAFALGFAPGGNAVQAFLTEQGVEAEEMVAAGLLVKREGGAIGERFRQRLMFPITDHRGRVVGFGGRLIGPGEPKYLNSPETKVFHKKGLLYGLHLALPALRKQKTAVLVEGYLDVIALYQHGITNVVAGLGTSFTPEHGDLLKRYVREVILLFDNDAAGRRATERAIDIFRERGLRVRMALLPEGQDPDEFLQQQGREALLARLNEALPVIPYRLWRLKQEIPWDEPGGKTQLLRRLFPDWAKLTSQVERQEYINFLARELNLAENAIRDDFARNLREERGKYPSHTDKSNKIRNNTIENAKSFRTPSGMAQKNLLRLLLRQPALTARVETELGAAVFDEGPLQEIYALLLDLAGKNEGETLTAAQIIFQAAENQKDFIAKLLAVDEAAVSEQQIEDTLKRAHCHHLEKQVEEKRKLIREAERKKDSLGVQNMLQEISDLQRKIHTLK